jgi:hypothetical protein
VLARDNSTQKTSGRWSGTLITSNFSRSVSLTVGPAAGNLAQAFTFQAAAAGGSVSSLRLLHNGRVIASARTPDAVFSIFGNTLGADTSDLRAEAIFTDGKRALSAPVTVTVAPTGSPAPVAPRAFGYTKFITPTNPATPTIVELPATFDSVLDSATYTILSNPAQATISGGNTLPYRLVTAAPGASGSDTISFRVNTPGGASSTAFITLVYSGIPSCVADLDDGNATGTPDGGVGIEDLLYYLGLYDAGLARADVDDGSGLGQPDGGVGIEDLLFYLSRYDAGC